MRTYLILPLLLTACPEYTLGGKVDISEDAVMDSGVPDEVEPPVEPDPPEDTGEDDPIEDPPEDGGL